MSKTPTIREKIQALGVSYGYFWLNTGGIWYEPQEDEEKRTKFLDDLESLISQAVIEALDRLERHVGDIHMERVGIPDLDSMTEPMEHERRRFKEAIQQERNRIQELKILANKGGES